MLSLFHFGFDFGFSMAVAISSIETIVDGSLSLLAH